MRPDELIHAAVSTRGVEQIRPLEDLGDYLEYGDWDGDSIAPVLNRLLKQLADEEDSEVAEALLNDLLLAAYRHNAPKLDLSLLVGRLEEGRAQPQLPPVLVPYALELLGVAGQRPHRVILLAHLASTNLEVRQAAARALAELDARAGGTLH